MEVVLNTLAEGDLFVHENVLCKLHRKYTRDDGLFVVHELAFWRPEGRWVTDGYVIVLDPCTTVTFEVPDDKRGITGVTHPMFGLTCKPN